MNPKKPSSKPSHLYVHVPFCSGACRYCAFHSEVHAPDLFDGYLDGLAFPLRPACDTVYFGGGTPLVLSPAELERLAHHVLANIDLNAGYEWTVETHPAEVTAEKIDLLKSFGVNRISIGAQCFDDAVLSAANRRHTAADIVRAVELVRARGIEDVGIDLIAGLPGTTRSIWTDTLARTIALDLPHVSVYGLSVENGSALADEEYRPDEDLIADLLSETEQTLPHERYEISNYARPGRRCRHNLNCWTGGDYLGIGPSASSRLGLLRRTEDPIFSEETLTAEQDRLERFIFQFRLSDGVDIASFPELREPLAKLARNGLVFCENDRWKLTGRGREVLDFILTDLMASL